MKNYRRIKPIKAAQYKGKSHSDAKKFCKENEIANKRWEYSPKDHCEFVITNHASSLTRICLQVYYGYYVAENVDFFRSKGDGEYEVYSDHEFESLYEEVEGKNEKV